MISVLVNWDLGFFLQGGYPLTVLLKSKIFSQNRKLCLGMFWRTDSSSLTVSYQGFDFDIKSSAASNQWVRFTHTLVNNIRQRTCVTASLSRVTLHHKRCKRKLKRWTLRWNCMEAQQSNPSGTHGFWIPRRGFWTLDAGFFVSENWGPDFNR